LKVKQKPILKHRADAKTVSDQSSLVTTEGMLSVADINNLHYHYSV